MYLEYILKQTDTSETIKNILQKQFKISSRLYQKLLRHSSIKINNNIYYEKVPPKLNKDDLIRIDLNYEEDNSNIVPTPISMDIIYEDEWILVINKSSGIPIHPSNLHYKDSLSNGVRYYFDSIGLKKKIRPVNRLDLNTSGLVVFAKCEYIHSILSLQMQNKKFVKKYLAIVEGIFEKKNGTIDLPISRKQGSIIERCIIPNKGQTAITHYKVLKQTNNLSLVECTLETGRTHQIRVHMSYIGHPVLADSLYGMHSDLIEGQALHSYYIKFIHPIFNKEVEFTCIPSWYKLFQ